VIALTESWLDKDIGNAEIAVPGYQSARRDRNRRGGGIVLYIKDNISFSTPQCHDTLELLSVEVSLRHHKLLLILYYRPPSSTAEDLSLLESYLETIPPTLLRSAILLGDFNINLLSPNYTSHQLHSLTSKMNFTQVVQQPTRIFNNSNSLIDHVYLNEPESLEYCEVTPPLDSSDHNCISISVKRLPRLVNRKRRIIWRYNQADFDTANSLLSEIPYDPLQSNSIDSSWAQWKDKFLSIMSQCIPNKIASIKNEPRWITRKIKLLIKKRSRLFQQAKRGYNPRVWKYQSARNKIVSAVRSAKATYLRNLTNQLNAPRDFWSHYHSVKCLPSRIPATLQNGSTSSTTTLSKANMLNKYFCSFMNPKLGFKPSTPPSSVPLLSSITCSQECIQQLLSTMKTKTASGPDNISSHMLKNTARSISPFLHELFNLSLSTGKLPSEWKISNVTPIPKSGDASQCCNYRPISLLSLVSKTFERIIHNQLLNFLLKHSRISRFQFGFRPNSSTQEALLHLTNEWHQQIDSGNHVAAIFFDLPKAFQGTAPRNTAKSVLHKLFNLSLSTGQLPSEWKVSNVTQIPKQFFHLKINIAMCQSYHHLQHGYHRLKLAQ